MESEAVSLLAELASAFARESDHINVKFQRLTRHGPQGGDYVSFEKSFKRKRLNFNELTSDLIFLTGFYSSSYLIQL